ncbi:MAG: hypothetical protein QGG88_01265 [Gammaproteobacteria bacterium]|nr:hypothetical protein [Gammaproteobacteria bacterium]
MTAYLLIAIVTQPLVTRLQVRYLPEMSILLPWLCLHYGVHILTTWHFGWRSIIYLCFATNLTITLLYPEQPITWNILTFCMLAASIAYITFEIFKLAGWNLYNQENIKPEKMWYSLILLGMVSSMLYALAINIYFSDHILPEDSINTIPFIIICNTISATVTILSFALLWNKGVRKSH